MNTKPILAIALVFAMVISFSGIANLGILAEEQEAKADLTVGDVWYSPEKPKEGDIVEIHAVIKNNGTAVAENFVVEFKHGLPNNMDGLDSLFYTIGTVEVKRIGAGEKQNITVKWNTTGHAGENLIGVNADSKNTVNESNENNNYKQVKVFVEKSGNEGGLTLKGTVYNAKTNETVAKAIITLYGIYDPKMENQPTQEKYYYTTSSNENGNYVFYVNAGEYNIGASAENYEYYSEYIIIEGNATHNIFLKPYPAPNSVLQGHVYSFNSGKPIHKAMITLSAYYDYNYYAPEKNYGYYYTTTTDENGSYAIKVHSGSYSISVYAENFEGYYASINIPENKTMNFDIALKKVYVPEKNCKVKGIVKDAKTLKPIIKAKISIYLGKVMPMMGSGNMDNSMMKDRTAGMPIREDNYGYNYYGNYEAITDENGNYVVETTAGYYYITVWAEGYESFYGNFEITDNTTKIFDVSLKPYPEPNSEVNGVVSDVDGNAIANAYVYVYKDYSIYNEEKQIRQNGEMMNGSQGTMGSGEKGVPENADNSNGMMEETPKMYPTEDYKDYNIQYYDGYFYKSINTDEKGHYLLKIPEGNYIIQVYANGFAPYYGNFEIADGKVITIDIKLKKGEGYNYSGDMMMKPEARKNFDGKNINFVPKVKKEFGEIKIKAGEKIKINLKDYFDDIDSNLTFRCTGNNKIIVMIDSNSATITIEAPKDFKGNEELTLYASDGDSEISAKSTITVVEGSSSAIGISSVAVYIVAILVAVGVIFGVRYLQNRKQ